MAVGSKVESAQQLPTSGNIQQVSISDDGQIIAFTRQLDENHEELWAINADGRQRAAFGECRGIHQAGWQHRCAGYYYPGEFSGNLELTISSFYTYPIYPCLMGI